MGKRVVQHLLGNQKLKDDGNIASMSLVSGICRSQI